MHDIINDCKLLPKLSFQNKISRKVSRYLNIKKYSKFNEIKVLIFIIKSCKIYLKRSFFYQHVIRLCTSNKLKINWSSFNFIVHYSCNLLLFRIIFVFRNFSGFSSKVSFVFWWWKACQFNSFFPWHTYHPYNVCRKEVLKVPLYPLPSCKNKYPKEQQISVLPLLTVNLFN